MNPSNLIVLLVGPRQQGNLGAAARAVKNCGLKRLRMVGGVRIGKVAKSYATHAVDVLSKSKRYADFARSIADAQRVVGFTAKTRRFGPKHRELPEIAAELRAASKKGKVILVFGREDHGLTNEEVQLCTDLVKIPGNPSWPVFNLAQSVLLACYEIAMMKSRGLPTAQNAKTIRQVSRNAQRLLLDEFRSLLAQLSYEEPSRHNRSARILTRLSAQLDRMLLEESDLQLWMGLLRRIRQRL